MTDTPQILSGSKLAIFDPCHHAFPEGGADFDFVRRRSECADQVSVFPFDLFPAPPSSSPVSPSSSPLSPSEPKHFPGTIIRLPLRSLSRPSALSDKPVSTQEIKELLLQFVRLPGEMDSSLLFLSGVRCVEVWEILDSGEGGAKMMARAEIVRGPLDDVADGGRVGMIVQTWRADVNVNIPGEDNTDRSQSWRIVHASFDEVKSAALLRSRLELEGSADLGSVLDKNKLLPNVGIAIPLPLPSPASSSPNTNATTMTTKITGRLFTFLPLPIQTAFPCHVHALFALTQDRQSLKCGAGARVGLSAGSDDWYVSFACLFAFCFSLLFSLPPVVSFMRVTPRLTPSHYSALIEWNNILFDTYIPSTWATLLSILLAHDCIAMGNSNSNIFNAWPPSQPLLDGGDAAAYRHAMPRDVLRAVLSLNGRHGHEAAIWPLVDFEALDTTVTVSLTKGGFADIGSVLVSAGDEDEDGTLAALAMAGVRITRPPRYIADLLRETGVDSCQWLTPQSAYWRLLVSGFCLAVY